jgi:shikimate kinase
MPKHNIIYITGFMGSGKSTAGKKLASALGWSFMDLDKEIERINNRTIAEIFSESGEEFFRKTESDVLYKLDIQDNTIVSVGGGTPCFHGNMDFMKNSGLVIYLRMTPEQLKSRLSKEKGERPLLTGLSGEEILNFIKQKLAERESFYNQAPIIVDGMDLDEDSLVQSIRNIVH